MLHIASPECTWFVTYVLLSSVECILRHFSLLVYNKAESALIFIGKFQGMKNYFVSHLPKGKWNTKLPSLPNFNFPVEAHEAGQIYLGGFEDMAPHENCEIFNAKSCILSISSEKVLFENKLIFLTCFFFVYNQFEIWI